MVPDEPNMLLTPLDPYRDGLASLLAKMLKSTLTG